VEVRLTFPPRINARETKKKKKKKKDSILASYVYVDLDPLSAAMCLACEEETKKAEFHGTDLISKNCSLVSHDINLH
jgi:hypothetical protein